MIGTLAIPSFHLAPPRSSFRCRHRPRRLLRHPALRCRHRRQPPCHRRHRSHPPRHPHHRRHHHHRRRRRQCLLHPRRRLHLHPVLTVSSSNLPSSFQAWVRAHRHRPPWERKERAPAADVSRRRRRVRLPRRRIGVRTTRSTMAALRATTLGSLSHTTSVSSSTTSQRAWWSCGSQEVR